MSELQAISLAREFKKVDKTYKKADKKVKNLLEEGYTPEEALMLTGIAGYEN